VSAVLALRHADWLGLVPGAVRRGAGTRLDPELIQAGVDALDDVEGEIEDAEGQLDVLERALLHLGPLRQDLGVLDEDERLTERGLWGDRRRCAGAGATDTTGKGCVRPPRREDRARRPGAPHPASAAPLRSVPINA
jgi:hypothetical protein